jgi:hypothetical protein
MVLCERSRLSFSGDVSLAQSGWDIGWSNQDTGRHVCCKYRSVDGGTIRWGRNGNTSLKTLYMRARIISASKQAFALKVLFDKVRQNAEALRQVGERALADARMAGVPVYYMDDAFRDDIIREFPDGHRERIVRGEDGAIIPIGGRP